MTIHIKVHGYHIDVFKHVNNARYLEFYEEARWVFTGKQGFLDWALSHKRGMAVINVNINYLKGAALGDELTVLTKIESIGAKNGVFYQQITKNKDGKARLVSDCYSTFVFIDTDTNKLVPVDGELLKQFELLALSSDEIVEKKF